MAMTSLSRWATRAAASLPSTHTQPSAVVIAASEFGIARCIRPSVPPSAAGSKDLPATGPIRLGGVGMVDLGIQDVADGQDPHQTAAAHDGQVPDAQLQHQM